MAFRLHRGHPAFLRSGLLVRCLPGLTGLACLLLFWVVCNVRSSPRPEASSSLPEEPRVPLRGLRNCCDSASSSVCPLVLLLLSYGPSRTFGFNATVQLFCLVGHCVVGMRMESILLTVNYDTVTSP